MIDYALLAFAAFFGGALNTVAGGGTFLTLPALIFTGVPVVAANATSAIAVAPGYLGGAAGFRKELSGFPQQVLGRAIAAAFAGGLIGSLLLLLSSNSAFAIVVPFLLLAATCIFAFADKIQTWAANARNERHSGPLPIVLAAIYGGYFNGGLGIVLLALFSSQGMRDIHLMNGLKNYISFVISAISVVTFTLAGLVVWPQALVMMAAATVGGYAGAPFARILPPAFIRLAIIAIGAIMTLIFFARIP